MQDRAYSNNASIQYVELLDPLKINENHRESLGKIKSLLTAFPEKSCFEALKLYVFHFERRVISVKLTKSLKYESQPLFIDFNELSSLSVEDTRQLTIFLLHLKRNSLAFKKFPTWQKDIFWNKKAHFLVLEEKDDAVILRKVQFSNPLVVYQRKKDPADRRYAVLENVTSATGSFGMLVNSRRSMSCSFEKHAPITIKTKLPDKYRVAKFQYGIWDADFEMDVAEHENIMAAILAPDLAVKQLAYSDATSRSAMLMRLVPGEDLWGVIVGGKVKTDLERLEICLAIANALREIHARGGIHCDVKPTNIIYKKGEDGRSHATFVDYGLSIWQRDGHLCPVGTFIYAAPEVLNKCVASVASDVYSLGRIFENVFGYFPSWETGDYDVINDAAREFYYAHARLPFDKDVLSLNKSNQATLNNLGWSALLIGMRTLFPEFRMTLDEVIKRLESLIAGFKAKMSTESRSIFSPAATAASAAAESDQKSESGTPDKPSLRP